MATDVHRRGHGRSLEGLSVVAGAAHLIPPDAGPRNNAQAALLRASYQQYVGVNSSPGDAAQGQLSFRHKADSFGPKLVQGDYTYTTSRKSLMVSAQLMGSGALPPQGVPASAAAVTTAPGLRGTIPPMVPMNAANINTAAWRAYGSPSARNHQRPPLAPGTAGGGGSGPAPTSPSGSKLPRVGGFQPRRPQSAPGSGADGANDLGSAIAAMASRVNVGGRHGKVADLVDVGVLAVDQPDPIWAGRTDSGRIMFEYTLPTDPYAKYIWEEQARKARANMSRHIAAMAAAAAVNGGNAFSHGSSGFATAAASAATAGGGGGASRPGSAKRGAGASMSASGTCPGIGGPATGMRPRFSSTTLAEVARQGPDHKPPTVLGFAAPDLTEDITMPSPSDPRWAYTRLGRSQIGRLQQSLKMCNAPHHHMRPSSAPAAPAAAATTATTASAGVMACVGTDSSTTAGGIGVDSSERSLARGELSVLDPFSDPAQGIAAATAALGTGGAATAGHAVELEGQRSSPVAMLRTGSGSGGTRPGSAGVARPGSASFARAQSTNLARTGSQGLSMPRPGSAGLMRPGSAGPMRTGSGTGTGGAGSAVNFGAALVADAAAAPAVPTVRGASAGRSREAAPNPRVDLRMYLAEAEAEAGEDDDEGTEMLPVGDLMAGGLYDGGGAVLVGADGLPLPPEVLQSMPVPADQLAARLAEMVAAVAVVAAQKQFDGGEDEQKTSGSHPHVQIEEVDEEVHDAGASMSTAAANTSAADPAEPPQPPAQSPPPPTRFIRPDGDDALAALHGASTFGGRGAGRLSSTQSTAQYGSHASGQYDSDSLTGWGDEHAAPPMEQPLGLGLGLGPRPGSRAGRPTSARPISARPVSARPTSALPGRRSGSPMRGLGDGGGMDGGMDVILEQSEGTVGEEY
ncbi:hypothetical protein Vretimale_3515 [Volvox reticuliferus]|uniref:Uncharacterized protein n=1 Tax=Volvox reticuliferus TaxID=1737510 RepID=A0A8J4BXS7_9CHLO|nr:hypothetical protein Vretifemale_1076 [Volvox reticuliferus]GIL97963.1 hypothetical protein Vretimale_3515 [Volvox reticuliferus]